MPPSIRAAFLGHLPGLHEKPRDWQSVTERIKDGEKLVRACYTVAVYAPWTPSTRPSRRCVQSTMGWAGGCGEWREWVQAV